MSNGVDSTDRATSSKQAYVVAGLSSSCRLPGVVGRRGLSRKADAPMFITLARPQQPSQHSKLSIPTFAASASTSNTPMRATT